MSMISTRWRQQVVKSLKKEETQQLKQNAGLSFAEKWSMLTVWGKAKVKVRTQK